MNSRKTSGAPGRRPNLTGDITLEVLCGNHAGHPFVGEKPHLWSYTHEHGRQWVCAAPHGEWTLLGFGPSPARAYGDWCLKYLTAEAQDQGLYAAPEEAQ